MNKNYNLTTMNQIVHFITIMIFTKITILNTT